MIISSTWELQIFNLVWKLPIPEYPNVFFAASFGLSGKRHDILLLVSSSSSMSFVSILLLFVSDCRSSGGGCGGGADDIDSLVVFADSDVDDSINIFI